MIISQSGRRSLWATAGLILFVGAGSVDAHQWEGRQAPSTASTSTPTSRSSSLASPQTTGVAPTFFHTDWPGFNDSIPLNQSMQLEYIISPSVSPVIQQQADSSPLYLNLMWTTAAGTNAPTSANTWEVIQIQYVCNNSTSTCQWLSGNSGTAKFNLAINPDFQSAWEKDAGVFFLCFVTAATITNYCESYSPFFYIDPPTPASNPNVVQIRQEQASISLGSFTDVLSVTQTTLIVTSSGSLARATSTPGSYTTTNGQVYSFSMYTTSAPVSTVTIPPTGTATPSSVAPSSSKLSSALSTGAIAGIAVGAAVVILLALLVGFFCYRRSHRRRAQTTPEQVLLTHNMHNGRRGLMSEKSEAGGSILGSILTSRPSNAGPYDHLSSTAPYNGPVGTGRVSLPQTQDTLLPQRYPTSASMSTILTGGSNISRGTSDASGPRSTALPNFREPYHDVPRYGDVRHVPQVYQGNLQAPFLSEPSMTDEELTRLEEEERRIDAAILEAEGTPF